MTRPPDGVLDTVLSAEESVLAACLLDDDAFGKVCTIISSGDFYIESNSQMFAAIAKLSREQQPVTVVTLAHELDKRGQLDAVGAEPRIQQIAGFLYTGKGVETHARIIKQSSAERQILEQAKGMVVAAGRGDVVGARKIAQGPTGDWWAEFEEKADG